MNKLYTLVIALILSLSGTALRAQNFALQFDGANDKVGILDSPELNPTGAMTIEAWINASAWNANIWGGVIGTRN